MKSSIQLFVVTVVSCMVLMAHAQECTPATCPPGPVVVNFEYLNCTGERTYYVAPTMACTSTTTGYSSFSFSDATGIWTYMDLNNPTCDLTLPNVTYSRRYANFYGTCVDDNFTKRDLAISLALQRDFNAALEGSVMYLPSVNTSFVSPQEPQVPGNPKNLLSFSDAYETDLCYSPNNCTLPDGSPASLYTTILMESGNCSSVAESNYYNLVVGQCYYADGAYAAIQCSGANGFDINIYVDDNCAKPFSLQGFTSNCEDPAVEAINYCTTPVTPVTPVTPPPPSNSASILSIRPIGIIVTIVLALIY